MQSTPGCSLNWQRRNQEGINLWQLRLRPEHAVPTKGGNQRINQDSKSESTPRVSGSKPSSTGFKRLSAAGVAYKALPSGCPRDPALAGIPSRTPWQKTKSPRGARARLTHEQRFVLMIAKFSKITTLAEPVPRPRNVKFQFENARKCEQAACHSQTVGVVMHRGVP